MKNLSNLKLIVSDCDGVLTDGLIIYDSNDNELKNFSAHDGLGIKILNHTNIIFAVITGRKSLMLEKRCKDLNVKYLFQGINNKKKSLDCLLSELNLKYENVAYIGDDWNDYPAMQCCQLKIAPNNALDNFKITVDYVTKANGGYGAVREAIEYILKTNNIFETALESFLNELSKK